MLQCTRRGCDGNSGHTSRTRSQRVTTVVEAERDELVEVLGPVAADVDAPPLASPGPRWDGAASDRSRRSRPRRCRSKLAAGWLRPSGSARCSRCRGTAPAVAAAPDDGCAGPPVARWRAGGRDGGRHPRRRAARRSGRDRSGSSGRGRRPQLRRVATRSSSRSRRRWYDTRLCGASRRAVSSDTARSLLRELVQQSPAERMADELQDAGRVGESRRLRRGPRHSRHGSQPPSIRSISIDGYAWPPADDGRSPWLARSVRR